MNNKVFIPRIIKVGYQERSDTYTGRLAYVIYYDAKGKLRKKTSWQAWRNHEIKFNDYDNKPMSGFVLNKKAGGYSTGWNHRQTYCRVYDPRAFEFEITIPNLLYILDNTDSIKGKGLEGEFVYGWNGIELLLIPTAAPDYVASQEFSNTLHNQTKLKGKNLVLGATYLTKQNEHWIYLGRFDLYETSKWSTHHRLGTNKGKYYFFAHNNNYRTLKYPSQGIIDTVSTECVYNYATLMDKLECKESYSPHADYKYVELTTTEIENVKRYMYVYAKWNNQYHDVTIYPQSAHNKMNSYIYNDSIISHYHHIDPHKTLSLQELHKIFHFHKRIQYLTNGKIAQ